MNLIKRFVICLIFFVDEVKSDSPIPFNGMIPVIPSYIPQSTASTTCTGTQARKRGKEVVLLIVQLLCMHLLFWLLNNGIK